MATPIMMIMAIFTFVAMSMFIGFFILHWEDMSGGSIWEIESEAGISCHGYAKPEIISWSPRIFLHRNFLSMEECDHLKEIAVPHLQISMVVDDATGKAIKSDERTSSGMFLFSKDPMIQEIEKRISVYSQIPVENGESIQVLRYEKDEYYRPHHDYFLDPKNLKYGGQRMATMLMYLSDNPEGGETFFPKAGSSDCSCGRKLVKGLCIKPTKGDALLFWNVGLDGQEDNSSLHGGCEVLSGEKWLATKWMRRGSLFPPHRYFISSV